MVGKKDGVLRLEIRRAKTVVVQLGFGEMVVAAAADAFTWLSVWLTNVPPIRTRPERESAHLLGRAL